MTPFRFRLERVLVWRRRELDLEQHKARQLAAALEDTARAIALNAVERTAAETAVAGAHHHDGAELEAHAAYLDCLVRRERKLEKRRLEQERNLAEQRVRLMEARRRAQLLEKLRSRRLEEWEAAANRELESFAAESHLNRWRPGPR
ncbi:MAG: hypothetical protein IT159_05675 [Bryobacterales bacterium]|mgnify:CR=1 FL=1|nr:hypothetical protein [Bryobacterales bacterium]